jgi:hypothetical protein
MLSLNRPFVFFIYDHSTETISDDPILLDPCADCLQPRHDLCLGDEHCTDGGVSACDPSACADQCPAHDF